MYFKQMQTLVNRVLIIPLPDYYWRFNDAAPFVANDRSYSVKEIQDSCT